MLKFSQILICLPAWLILAPLLILPTIVLLLFTGVRKVIDLIVTRWLHPDWAPIYPPDAVFANVLDKPYPGEEGSENCFANYSSVVIFSEPITAEEIRSWYKDWTKTQITTDENGVMRMSQVYEKISRVPVKCLSYYYWAPVQIDWDKVIVEWIPCYKTGYDFDEYFTTWLSKRFVSNILHEILIARPSTGKYAGKTVLCSKLSHLIGDGVSAAREVLGIGFGLTPGIRKREEIPKFIKPSWAEVLLNIVTFPRLLYQINRLQRVQTLSKLIPNHSSEVEAKMLMIVDSVPLSSVKTISKALRIPFREVLACATMSAIRRLVLKNNILKASELPNEISCLVPIIWPYKRKRGFQPLGNNATSMLFLYPIKLDDPLERMKIAHKAFVENLQCGVHRMIYYTTWLGYLLPSPIMKSRFFSQIPLTVNSVDCASIDIIDLPFLGKYSALARRIVGVALSPDGNSFSTDCLAMCWSNAKENLITATFTLNSRLFNDESMGQELADCFKLEIQELLAISAKEEASATDMSELIPKMV